MFKQQHCFLAILLLLLLTNSSARAFPGNPEKGDTITYSALPDSTTTLSTHKYFNRKVIVGAGLTAWTATMLYTEYKWWWKGNYHPFAYQYEGFIKDYSYGVDKFGHFYISYFCTQMLYDAMKWGGYSDNVSLFYSALVPALYALSVEIADGYSTYYFAPDDLAANLLGIGYSTLQHKVPFFQNFNVKWSFWPTAAYSRSKKWSFTEDYNGHAYWLSTNVHGLLPPSAKRYWPKFLNIAIGYGANNVSYGDKGPKQHRYYIGLDYNLMVLPGKNDTWHVVKHFLDMFHYPAPVLRNTEGSGTDVIIR